MPDDVTIRYPRPGVRVEEWTSPGGTYKETTFIYEEYEHETREEWAERLGLDISVFQHPTNNETPEERAERIAKARAEIAEIRKERGVGITPEEQAEVDAVMERMGFPPSAEGDGREHPSGNTAVEQKGGRTCRTM